MRTIKATDFLPLKNADMWQMPDERFYLEFVDKTIVTTSRETIYSSYAWNIHRHFPDTPLLSTHHLCGQLLGGKSHLNLLGEAVWDCAETYERYGQLVDMEVLEKLTYDAYNALYNDVTRNCEAYVDTISALDFTEVLRHPKIKAANDLLKNKLVVNDEDITVTHREVERVLKDPTELKDNAIAKAAKNGLVSMGQILQCVSARGMVTDIDSHIFRNAIRVGFAEGLTKLEDVLKESRTAGKAHLFAKDPMRKSEYFNRNIQLSAATLVGLHQYDCGSTDYIPWTVKNKKVLRDSVGIAYWDEEASLLKKIGKADTQLIGKTLNIRSVFTCKHPESGGICRCCFGELGRSIPRNTNVGHFSSAALQNKVAQLLLSSKHLEGSAGSDQLLLSENDNRFIRTGEKDNRLYIRLKKGTKQSLVVPEVEASNLTDVMAVTNTDKLTPARISEITDVMFVIDEGSVSRREVVSVSANGRLGSLSREMLRHVKQVGWTIDENGHYVISLDGWDFSLPFIELPMKHFSTVDYMLGIEGFIKGGGKRTNTITNYSEPAAALAAFHDMVSLRLEVHVSYLQTIILSTMVQSLEGRDYNLPFPRELGKPSKYRDQMELRSLSAAMAFQGHATTIFSPAAFLIKNRPPHPLDWLLLG